MQYKTIILELLQQRPPMHEQLRTNRSLLQAVELYAAELRNSHEAWKEALHGAKADSDPSQIAGEALELALKEVEASLLIAFPPDDEEALSLDAAMASISPLAPHD